MTNNSIYFQTPTFLDGYENTVYVNASCPDFIDFDPPPPYTPGVLSKTEFVQQNAFQKISDEVQRHQHCIVRLENQVKNLKTEAEEHLKIGEEIRKAIRQENSRDKAVALKAIALKYAKIRKVDQAFKILKSIPLKIVKLGAQLELGLFFAKEGQFKLARTMAKKLNWFSIARSYLFYVIETLEEKPYNRVMTLTEWGAC